MPDDQNLAKLRWLLTVAAKSVGLTLSINMINRVCDAQNALMQDNGMVLMWQSRVNEMAAELEHTPRPSA